MFSRLLAQIRRMTEAGPGLVKHSRRCAENESLEHSLGANRKGVSPHVRIYVVPDQNVANSLQHRCVGFVGLHTATVSTIRLFFAFL
jgi:hypothetical protein